MLKLETSSDCSDVAIRIREKESIFETRLLRAFVLALVIHLSAWVVFHVTPFSLLPTFVFSPVEVSTEIPSKHSESEMVVSPWEEGISIPAPPISFMPELDWLSPAIPSSLLDSVSVDVDAFSYRYLEENFRPQWQMNALSSESSMQLSISGNLASYALLNKEAILREFPFVSLGAAPLYITYEVYMDEMTGEIFWYQQRQTSGNVSVDQIVEKILLNLRFELVKFPQNIFVSGELHFVLLERD